VFKVWVESQEWNRFARLTPHAGDFRRDDWRFAKGKPATGHVPDDLVFDVDPQFGVELADELPNTFRAHVLAERFASAVAELGVKLERFPVGIRNARGRIVPDRYELVNLLEAVPCVDLERSTYITALVKGQLLKVTKLVLDPSKVDAARPLFRIGEAPFLWLVRDDVVEAWTQAGFTGCRFVAVEDYAREHQGL